MEVYEMTTKIFIYEINDYYKVEHGKKKGVSIT